MRTPHARGLLLILACWLPADAQQARAVTPQTSLGQAISETLADSKDIRVELIEGIKEKSWNFESLPVSESYSEPAFAFVEVPAKYSPRGIILDRTNPYVLRASADLAFPEGAYRLLLRARGAAKLLIDDQLLAETNFAVPNASGHDPVPELPAAIEPGLRSLPPGCQERVVNIDLDGREHHFELKVIVGGKNMRAELGELSVSIAGEGEPFRLLSAEPSIPLDDDGWQGFVSSSRARMAERNAIRRRGVTHEEATYWEFRHELARGEWALRDAIEIPLVSNVMPVHNAIDRFINARLESERVQPAPLCDDWTFLRRVTLDTVGVIPSRREIAAFQADQSVERRANVIDRLLADPRWADHWVSYWQDVLAENPGILKPELNNTGPFRWWIHESFTDNKPLDRFVTELVMMEGSLYAGGTAGFAMASQNDAPMADKAYVLAKAFMGAEMKCARCHDAPYHPFKQKDTFSLAAMLSQKSQKLPATSTVPVREGARKPLIQISLKPGDTIDPAWPFAAMATDELLAGVIRQPDNQRERLAAILTSPRNTRFAQVAVNRLWKRYLGHGLVEPVDDWLDIPPSHPELLDYLSGELVTHGYDLKHVARLIFNSHTYQRAITAGGDASLFASPVRRRLSAEQVVDSLFMAAGKEFRSEELNLDIDGRRPIKDFLNLGVPRRAWEFTSLSNERDRPALSLPVAQSILDVLVTFGWRQSRPNPITVRDETAMALQPLMIANGMAGSRITRLSNDSAITALCLEQQPLEQLVQSVFQQVLTRPAEDDENAMFVELLSAGYEDRIVASSNTSRTEKQESRTAVSWSNHLSPEATRIKLELERAARAGDPPTDRLSAPWRERMEDMLWALVNSPEFMFVP